MHIIYVCVVWSESFVNGLSGAAEAAQEWSGFLYGGRTAREKMISLNCQEVAVYLKQRSQYTSRT